MCVATNPWWPASDSWMDDSVSEMPSWSEGHKGLIADIPPSCAPRMGTPPGGRARGLAPKDRLAASWCTRPGSAPCTTRPACASHTPTPHPQSSPSLHTLMGVEEALPVPVRVCVAKCSISSSLQGQGQTHLRESVIHCCMEPPMKLPTI